MMSKAKEGLHFIPEYETTAMVRNNRLEITQTSMIGETAIVGLSADRAIALAKFIESVAWLDSYED